MTSKMVSNTIQNPIIATTFLDALQCGKVLEFVKSHFSTSYYQAILHNHPNPSTLSPVDIKKKCEALVERIITTLLGTTVFQLPETMQSLSQTDPYSKDFWFEEFHEAYLHYKQQTKVALMGSFLLPHLRSSKSFIDIGCGGGELTRFLSLMLPTTAVSGCDVLDWRSDRVKKEKNFDFIELDISKELSSSMTPRHDTGLLYEVIHHAAGTWDETVHFLKQAKKMIQERLLIVEDVYFNSEDLQESCLWHDSLVQKRNEDEAFNRYCLMSQEEQKAYLIVLDTLSNYLAMGVSEMALPFGFLSVSKWKKILEESGWRLSHVEIIGFPPKFFHRTSNVLFVCEPKEDPLL